MISCIIHRSQGFCPSLTPIQVDLWMTPELKKIWLDLLTTSASDRGAFGLRGPHPADIPTRIETQASAVQILEVIPVPVRGEAMVSPLLDPFQVPAGIGRQQEFLAAL